mmetsp:Transcript_27401/g.57179  ORF Transcript_27401/g.57179 Transcript_27401/m.57179 type:complete len:84 (+) Transcript_27401:202-453(+)
MCQHHDQKLPLPATASSRVSPEYNSETEKRLYIEVPWRHSTRPAQGRHVSINTLPRLLLVNLANPKSARHLSGTCWQIMLMVG